MLDTSRASIAFILVTCACACGSSVTRQQSGGSTGAGGASTSSSSSSHASSTASASSGAGGTICGGLKAVTCPPDAFCDYANDLCGGDDGTGICAPRPQGCTDNYQPTCGCDGLIHGNPCEANVAGFDVSALGNCKPPPAMFACGTTFCSGAQYCRHSVSDIGGTPDTFECVALPPPCTMGGDPGCACLVNEPCGTLCTVDPPSGGMTVTCPGG